MSGSREGFQGAAQRWRTENNTYHLDKNPQMEDSVQEFPIKAEQMIVNCIISVCVFISCPAEVSERTLPNNAQN